MRAGANRAIAALALLAGLAACESFTPEWVDRLDVTPDSAHISAGETVTFAATPLSARDTPLTDRAERVTWSLNAPGVATLDDADGVGEVTAVDLGQAVLVARLGRGVAQVPVFVQPPGLDRIEIVPDRIDVAVGTRPRVEARLYDAQGNLLSPEGFRVSWAIPNTQIGFVGTPTGPSADLLARRTGTTEVRLIVGSRSTAIPFIVR